MHIQEAEKILSFWGKKSTDFWGPLEDIPDEKYREAAEVFAAHHKACGRPLESITILEQEPEMAQDSSLHGIWRSSCADVSAFPVYAAKQILGME